MPPAGSRWTTSARSTRGPSRRLAAPLHRRLQDAAAGAAFPMSERHDEAPDGREDLDEGEELGRLEGALLRFGTIGELLALLARHGRWWMVPLVVVLLVVGHHEDDVVIYTAGIR